VSPVVRSARDEASTDSKHRVQSAFGPGLSRPQPLWPFLLIAGLVIAAVHLGLFFLGGLGPDHSLRDTDAYTWLNRVTHLAQTGAWFDHVYPRINPPEGHVQHWTRPLDLLLLGGGALWGTVLGFDRGLYYWALVLPPLMHLAALIVLVWAAQPLVRRDLLPRAGIPTLLLVFVAQLGAYEPFLLGRPDHHALVGLLFLAYLGFLLRLLLDSRNLAQSAIGLGLVGALAVWVNVEALVFVVLGLFALGLSWLFGNDRLGRVNAIHGLTVFGAAVIAWLVQWGPGALQVSEMDTLSIPHVGVFGLAALFWIFLWWSSRAGLASDLPHRVVLAAAGGLVVLSGTHLMFPQFFGDPLHGVDSLYRETRLDIIGELQPLLASDEGAWRTARRVVMFASAAMAALLYLVLRLIRAADRDQRILCGTLAALVGFYLYMAFQQRRWTDYVAISATIPFSLLALSAIARLPRRAPRWTLTLARPLVLVGLVFGPIFLAAALGSRASNQTRFDFAELVRWDASDTRATVTIPAARDPARQACDLARVAEVLEDPIWFPLPELVLAYADHGPELLYRTRHAVLAIPNHRPQPGYAFTWHVLTDTDVDRASAALRGRDVGAVLLCASDLAAGFYPMRHVENSFLRYLAKGGIPYGYELHAATPYWRLYRRAGSWWLWGS
jgi:hypothetical protein